MKASITVPLGTFIFGTILSIYAGIAVHTNDEKARHADLVFSAREYSKQFELNILNNTLRVQSLIDVFGATPSKLIKDKFIVEEILRNSIFQRIVIFKKETAESSNGLPVLRRMSSTNLSKDELPKPTSSYMTSEYLRKKIKSMQSIEELSSFTFTENENGEFVTLIWRISSLNNQYAVFFAPIKSLFVDSVSSPNGQLIITDDETNFKLLVSWNSEGKFQVIKGSKINEFENNENSILLSESKIRGSPSLSFKWYMSPNQNIGLIVWIVFFTGFVITLLIALFLRFVLIQNSLITNLVIKRTEDLESALNEATEANLAKTRFLGNMSHELRTPLNLILGMLELIEEKNVNTKIADYIKSIRVSGDHLLRLISDLLEMAKQDSREVTIKSAPIRFPYFLEEIGQLIGADALKKGLEFHLRIDPLVPELIKGDPARLRQILMNLLRNSIKYTVSGSIRLNVSCLSNQHANSNHKKTIRFEIKDTGVGIPKSKQLQVFDRFLQLDSSKVLSQGGVGLGLSIVKDLVQILNGNIIVQSETGVGSSFSVDLDFETLSDLYWASSFIKTKRNDLNVAIISNNQDFILDIKCCLEHHVSKISDFNELQVSSSSGKFFQTDYSHVIIDLRCNLDLTHFSSPQFKNKLILINSDRKNLPLSGPLDKSYIDCNPMLPTPLLATLGIYRIENKSSDKKTDTVSQQLQKVEASNKKITVLIADDDKGNRQLLQAYLDDFGWNLLFSENGQEAFHQVQEFKPNVIIADLRMPIMDGLELTDRIRDYESMNRLEKTPIILVTADALEQTEEMARNHGVSHFLTKPIRKAKIVETILSVVK